MGFSWCCCCCCCSGTRSSSSGILIVSISASSSSFTTLSTTTCFSRLSSEASGDSQRGSKWDEAEIFFFLWRLLLLATEDRGEECDLVRLRFSVDLALGGRGDEDEEGTGPRDAMSSYSSFHETDSVFFTISLTLGESPGSTRGSQERPRKYLGKRLFKGGFNHLHPKYNKLSLTHGLNIL